MSWVLLCVVVFLITSYIGFKCTENDFKILRDKSLSETQIRILKEILYFLVMDAEACFGSGTGEAKFAFVIHKFYSNCPDFLKKIMSQNNFNVEEMVIEFLEEAVNRMRKYFTDNPFAKERLIESKF